MNKKCFYCKKSILNYGIKYCSSECYHLSKVKHYRKICKICKKEFLATSDQKNNILCSPECQKILQKRNLAPYIATKKGQRKYTGKCKKCGKEWKSSFLKKYCNQKCYFDSTEFKILHKRNGEITASKNRGKMKVKYRISWGYKYKLYPNHPSANKQGYVVNSKIIFGKFIKRYILPQEVIHHINGNRSDDRIENLLYFRNNAVHTRFHLFAKYHKIPIDKLKFNQDWLF